VCVAISIAVPACPARSRRPPSGTRYVVIGEVYPSVHYMGTPPQDSTPGDHALRGNAAQAGSRDMSNPVKAPGMLRNIAAKGTLAFAGAVAGVLVVAVVAVRQWNDPQPAETVRPTRMSGISSLLGYIWLSCLHGKACKGSARVVSSAGSSDPGM
jgi:hypothetical protein